MTFSSQKGRLDPTKRESQWTSAHSSAEIGAGRRRVMTPAEPWLTDCEPWLQTVMYRRMDVTISSRIFSCPSSVKSSGPNLVE